MNIGIHIFSGPPQIRDISPVVAFDFKGSITSILNRVSLQNSDYFTYFARARVPKYRHITKNLEIKKINDEKKKSLAAQFAVEATLRRVHAAQKDDEIPPIEAIIAPLEAELKLVRMEDDNRALDRLSKSKEAALLDAERSVEISMAKASLVDDLQNKNQELMKQIEICQNVSEVERLTQTVGELEEVVLAGGAAANVLRDYQCSMQEINEEKKIFDRELARAKISANRDAVVVAYYWKDTDNKVMPVKQWLEERRVFQRFVELIMKI
ncbi:hypothetical protein L2E82_12850 [Cichorium intybus]|uniref:Uncharacterized protein n=1 Tax=Cichorium intybus TaxID=13427 RepID=A0ACB9GH76_CICIN|nr:hypothetical protein L2E82_12850 [Cichorium intybus]